MVTYFVGQGVGLIDSVRPAGRVVQSFRRCSSKSSNGWTISPPSKHRGVLKATQRTTLPSTRSAAPVVAGARSEHIDDNVGAFLGGGVGMGFSQRAGMVVVRDGTPKAARRIERRLWNDPATGVTRHADTGFATAIDCAREHGLDLPGLQHRQ